mmetsp:Transcript_20231/g.77655  ORF Transcript_20231/g.77655 Transcript_20231/m.77655 type:complete len:236 (+) Transcript_20231:376-1083(+)
MEPLDPPVMKTSLKGRERPGPGAPPVLGCVSMAFTQYALLRVSRWQRKLNPPASLTPSRAASRKRKVQRPSTDPRTKLEASGKTLTTRDWNLRGDSNCRSGRGSMRMLNSSMAPALRLYALLEDASIWPPATTTRSRAASMLITVEARGTTCTQRGVRTSNTRSALSKPADTTAPISGMGTTLRTPASWMPTAVSELAVTFQICTCLLRPQNTSWSSASHLASSTGAPMEFCAPL